MRSTSERQERRVLKGHFENAVQDQLRTKGEDNYKMLVFTAVGRGRDRVGGY